MTTGNDALMRKLLDQVDAIRRRQRIVMAILFVTLVGGLVWIGYISGRPQTDVKELVAQSVIVTVFAIVFGVVTLAMYINAQVRRILKAIEIVGRTE